MKQVKAKQHHIRMSPRKVALVTEAIKSLSPQEALDQLKFLPKRAAGPVAKLLKQGMANATNNSGLDPETLKIKKLEVKKGPTYKRWRPVARGRAHSILKRTCHIFLTLEGKPAGKKPSPKTAAPVKLDAKKVKKPQKQVKKPVSPKSKKPQDIEPGKASKPRAKSAKNVSQKTKIIGGKDGAKG